MNLFILFLVVVSTIVFYLSTVKELFKYFPLFHSVESVVMVIFTLELILRFLVIGQDPQYKGFYAIPGAILTSALMSKLHSDEKCN